VNWTLASLLSLSLLLAACASPTPAPTPPPDLFDTPWDDLSVFQLGLVPSAWAALTELSGASVYHLTFAIAPEVYSITGTQSVRYTNRESAPLTEIWLRLFPNILGGEMTVANLQAAGQSVTPRYDLNDSLMIVPLSTPLEPGQSLVLSMDFTISVPQEVELNYGVLAYVNEVLTLAHAYPMICVYDDEGWNAEIPPQDGDVTYADASFYLVKVTAPKALTLVTSGSQVALDEAGQTQTLSVAAGPARDFYLAASPNFERVTQTVDGVSVNSYAEKNSQAGAEFALKVAAQALQVFSARYAPYPYTELDIVATPTLALGIEYPGLIAITDRIYAVDGEYRGAPASLYMESTVAHEVGHQWFYSLVGGDQLDDPWLDESLTQFATLQYYADQYGVEGEANFRAALEDRWARAGNEKIPIGLPVAEYDGLYGPIVYGRGPLFFVALREQMGTAAFDAFLKTYTKTFRWGIATPEALQAQAESACACELDRVFTEWVYP
jgi:hypothetical protein